MQIAVIIGAGPAGLTAALEFCRRSSIRPIVLEASDRVGGLACTIQYQGNRIDLGGHRFFSKSDRVMDWWTEILPIAGPESEGELAIRYQNRERAVRIARKAGSGVALSNPERVMLVRPRKSRIYFQRSLFDYPLSLSPATLRRLGWTRALRILFSYAKAQCRPRRPESTLEDFFINRFGRELYHTFFKSYTEKVWGVPCWKIAAAWGVQRIKGLSLRTAVAHFVKKLILRRQKISAGIRQKNAETSLIEQFLYPKYGPGQLWETVAGLVEEAGGEVRLGWRVIRLCAKRDRILSLDALSPEGEMVTIQGDYFFSTMPVRELLSAIDAPIPKEIQTVAEGLVYRDFLVVGLLVDRLQITEPDGSPIQDTWIYIQEPEVLAGRMQIFNNWSPALVADPTKMWIGLEYFCSESDPLWAKPDQEIKQFAIEEAAKIGILHADEVREGCVLRVPKAYPAYSGTYHRFGEIVRHVDRFENLFLVGRNGMHKYNNQDHSMLAAMVAVDNILAGIKDKRNLWEINTEQEYHEQAKTQSEIPERPSVPHSADEKSVA